MSDDFPIQKIWFALKERKFFADVSINCKKIGVTIEYIPMSEMRVSGLKPEYPPYVWFRDGLIKISYDKKKWKTIEPGIGIQILRLLDPRLLLTPIQPPVIKIINYLRFGFVGEYEVEYLNKIEELKLKLPKELVSWMVEKGHKQRLIKIFLKRNYLISRMIQNDLPPSTESITLTFKYEDRILKRL